MSNTNKPAVKGSEKILDKLKYETTNEFGLPDYASMDKGNLTMTKKLIQYAENQMKG
jgi:hypothetical protein